MHLGQRLRTIVARELVREMALPVALALGIIGAWFAGPATVESVTRTALHGLCAQRPSHSFWFGPYQLPFDARMTGIYSGALFALVWLALRTRAASVRLPAVLCGLLGAGVASLALDGSNSLARDLGFPTLYEPHNLLRYSTGAWTGIALGTLLWWVFSSTTWHPSRRVTRVATLRPRDLFGLVALASAFGWLISTGPLLLYPFVALFLVLAAFVTLALLAWPFTLILSGRLERIASWPDAQAPAFLAAACALGVMALTSGLRYGVETLLGIPSLP